jgi:hypothetical protein
MEEMGLGARFSDTHETNCRSMSWLLIRTLTLSPSAPPHAHKTRREHALAAELTADSFSDLSVRAC